MCGIVGIVDFCQPVDAATLIRMRETLVHRGPDDAGAWVENDQVPHVGLAHRRLAILDRSAAGRQPLASADRRFVVVFNGEIYNYRELARELAGRGHSFQSQTDTEVLLAAFIEWGEACVERFNGMWALAIWDDREHRLFMSRDRLGKKPLFYHWNGSRLLFASEIKALAAHPSVTCTPDETQLARFGESFALPPAGRTMFAGIEQLPAAHSLSLDTRGQLTLKRYWQLDPENQIRLKNDGEYIERFRELFDDAVRIRLRADVPVGSSLSGGLDSSLIVGTIAKLRRTEQAAAGQHTFSARFPQQPLFDEGPYIDAVVAHNGVTPHTIVPQADDLVAQIRQLHWHQEEPFLSSSIFAQWEVMRRARHEQTIVLLDGQGSDELLGGYAPHLAFHLYDLARTGRWWRAWNEYRTVSRRQRALHAQFGGADQRAQMLSVGRVWSKLQQRLHAKSSMPQSNTPSPRGPNRLWQRLHADLTQTCLPLLLRYVDRNAMAHGVEVRNPFLDYRLIEFAMAIPNDLKIRDGWSKWILREVGKGVLPEQVRTRTDKVAFITPEDDWLRGPLKPWASNLLFGPRLRELANYPRQAVEQLWNEHQSGVAHHRQNLWPWLSLGEWLTMLDEQGLASGTSVTRAA
jgi:asparagine synthase (glutamine-hydrolysing)